MATKEETPRERRIRLAYNRLRRILKNVPKDNRDAATGLMRRVAFMQVSLEDLEADINLHGEVESFSQTEGIEYDRERPAVRIYNTTFRNYAAACKQLFDLLPSGEKTPEREDELMAFVKGQAR